MGVVVVTDRGWSELTLNWPEKRNSLAPDDAVEIAAAVEAVDARTSAAVIITGTGAFCAGGDLRAFVEITRSRSSEEIRELVYSKIQRAVRALRDCQVPTIAAVDGAAVGLGMDLALACDIRLVGSAGWLRQGWARAGLIPAAGGVFFAERLRPGLSWTELLAQNRLDGHACERLGLATSVAGPALPAARECAQQLAGLNRAMVTAQTTLYRSVCWPSPQFLDAAADAQARLLTSPGFADRVRDLLGTAAS